MTLLICLLTACGKSLEEQIAEQLELGQKYLAELNYEEAIVAFTKAIELEEKNADAYMGRGQVYEAMAQAAGEESADGKAYYEQAAREYERALSLSSGNPLLYDRLLTIYQITGNLEELEKLMEADQSGITDEAVLNRIKNIKKALDVVQQLADACEAREVEQAFDLMRREEFSILKEAVEEKNRPLCLVKNGKGIGIYPIDGNYMIYYGDYQGWLRHGHGLWLEETGNENMYYYLAEGVWSDDVPNGMQEEKKWSNDMEHYQCRIGTVEDGRWHGDVMWLFGDITYPVSFEHGKFVVLGLAERGDGEKHYYVSKTGIDSEGFSENELATSDIDRLEGIRGFIPR